MIILSNDGFDPSFMQWIFINFLGPLFVTIYKLTILTLALHHQVMMACRKFGEHQRSIIRVAQSTVVSELWLSSQGWSKERAGRKRIEERGGLMPQPQPPPHSSLNGFTLTSQFLLRPSGLSQTLLAGTCSQARSVAETNLAS